MSLSFSKSEYTVSESDSSFLVQLNKNKPLASPLEVGVAALTLEEAYFLGCIPPVTFYRFEQLQAGTLFHTCHTCIRYNFVCDLCELGVFNVCNIENVGVAWGRG